jgi:hypothetical protein
MNDNDMNENDQLTVCMFILANTSPLNNYSQATFYRLFTDVCP